MGTEIAIVTVVELAVALVTVSETPKTVTVKLSFPIVAESSGALYVRVIWVPAEFVVTVLSVGVAVSIVTDNPVAEVVVADPSVATAVIVWVPSEILLAVHDH
jgi:Flp pilus assembly secretin CpaC